MITINNGKFEAKGFETDIVCECMYFIHSLNTMIENNEIKIDMFCSLDVQELQKFAQHIIDGIKQLEKEGWFEFMAGDDSNV